MLQQSHQFQYIEFTKGIAKTATKTQDNWAFGKVEAPEDISVMDQAEYERRHTYIEWSWVTNGKWPRTKSRKLKTDDR